MARQTTKTVKPEIRHERDEHFLASWQSNSYSLWCNRPFHFGKSADIRRLADFAPPAARWNARSEHLRPRQEAGLPYSRVNSWVIEALESLGPATVSVRTGEDKQVVLKGDLAEFLVSNHDVLQGVELLLTTIGKNVDVQKFSFGYAPHLDSDNPTTVSIYCQVSEDELAADEAITKFLVVHRDEFPDAFFRHVVVHAVSKETRT